MNPFPQSLHQRAAAIKLLVLDVDGVLTDGTLFYGENGEAVKSFNVKDGLGIQLLFIAGIEVAVITARDSKIVARRARDLGISNVYTGCNDKAATFQELHTEYSLDPRQVAYIGDDILDLPVMKQVGLAIAPADGHHLVKKYAHFVTSTLGGGGVIREIADGLIASQTDLETICDQFLKQKKKRSDLARDR